MSQLLARIARSLTRHWKRGLLSAFVVVFLLGLAAASAGPAADDFATPGTESQEAYDLFQAHSPAFAGADTTLVFSVDEGSLTDPEAKAAIEGALAKVKELKGVDTVADPFAEGAQVSQDGRIAAVDVRYTTEPGEIEKEDGEALLAAADTAEPAVDVAARGILADYAAEQSFPVGELVGILIGVILLTLLFRSKAAMAASMVGALFGVALGQILITALGPALDLPRFAGVIAMMLGLGAGIDYALLIIGRYREQRELGQDPVEASGRAAATSGAAVLTAGLIVMVAIAGLLVVGIPFIGRMGLGAAVGVAAVVVSALTMLPIMMGALAKRLKPKKPEHVLPSRAFKRWGERITARPWVAVAAGTLVLLVLAAPTLGMRLGLPDEGNQPESTTQRQAYDKMSEAFGPGSNGPFLLAVDTPRGASETERQLGALQQAVSDTEGIVQVAPPLPSEDGEMATIFAVPATAPQDEATSDLLDRLRDEVLPAATAGTPLKVYVGGNTATFEDLSDKVASRLPIFTAVVIGLSVLLLIMAFRSLWIPLVSAVLNLLSVGAAYGVVTAVFQEGIGASLVGADSGVPIMSFIPVMLFAILFGLSMDYNVFLLSRIHERYNEGESPVDSVVHGMARIGKVILFAGLIMAAVFLAFVTQPDIIGKMMGLGLGLAILIDVVIVRLVITPAVVTLLGDKAWWMPAWLDRVLPDVSLEGAAPDRTAPAEA